MIFPSLPLYYLSLSIVSLRILFLGKPGGILIQDPPPACYRNSLRVIWCGPWLKKGEYINVFPYSYMYGLPAACRKNVLYVLVCMWLYEVVFGASIFWMHCVITLCVIRSSIPERTGNLRIWFSICLDYLFVSLLVSHRHRAKR